MHRQAWAGTWFAVLGVSACAMPVTQDDEPEVALVTAAIHGGDQASPNEWPFTVLLDRSDGLFCGGSLIDRRWVVTARHCVLGLSPNALRVVAGEHDRTRAEGPEQVIDVATDGLIYPIDGADEYKDIALVELASPVSLSSKVGLVRLAGGNDLPGQPSIVAGWGRTEDSRESDTLREARLPVVSNDVCGEIPEHPLGSRGFLYDHELCAGYRDGSAGTCQGDSGGPLVITGPRGHWELAGVTSKSLWNCTTEDAYARVSSHVSWIRSHVPDRLTAPLVGDLDGDGHDEMIAYQPTDRRWYARKTDGEPFFAPGDEPVWGAAGDIPLVGDLDGDEADELIMWRPSNKRWYALRADKTRFFAKGQEPVWGAAGDVPLLGDLDDDGADELIMWRPRNGKWYALGADRKRVFAQGDEPIFGKAGDVPLVGNLDGVGGEEMVTWRPETGTWYAMRADRSLLYPLLEGLKWGNFGDVPLLGNLVGTADQLIIWRPSNRRWYVVTYNGLRIYPKGEEPSYGQRGDLPFVADLDGGTAEYGVWRPSNARWFAKNALRETVVDGRVLGAPY